jgi:hypothetical protein
MNNNPIGHGNMGPVESFFWAFTTVALSTSMAFALGGAIGIAFNQTFGLGSAFALAWIGIFYSMALFRGSLHKQEFMVVERLMKFQSVKFAGLNLAFPFIDHVRFRSTFLGKDVELFMDDNDPGKRVEINFKEGSSAPIDASAWYQIANPEDIRNGRRSNIINDVLKYVYTLNEGDTEERVAEIFEGAFRPRLQALTIDEAQKDLKKTIETAVEDAKQDLADLGVYVSHGTGIIVRDIEIPQGILELRELELKGKKRAAEIAETSKGYWRSIQEIIDGAKASSEDISVEKAQEIFERQRAFDVIQQTGSNVTFIAPDMDGIVKTITVGSKGGK